MRPDVDVEKVETREERDDKTIPGEERKRRAFEVVIRNRGNSRDGSPAYSYYEITNGNGKIENASRNMTNHPCFAAPQRSINPFA